MSARRSIITAKTTDLVGETLDAILGIDAPPQEDTNTSNAEVQDYQPLIEEPKEIKAVVKKPPVVKPAKKSEPMTRQAILISVQNWNILKKLKAALDKPVNEILNELIESFINKNKAVIEKYERYKSNL